MTALAWAVALAQIAALAAGLAVAAAALRRTGRLAPAAAEGGVAGAPVADVAVVRPVFGLEPETEAALASLLDPAVAECVFSLQDPDDPALPLVRRLAAGSGGRARVVVAPVEPGFSGKTSNLLHGVAATAAPVLVLADADVVIPSEGLRRLVAPLAETPVGLVAAVPFVRGGRGLWGRLYQAHLNATVLLQWLPLAALGRAIGVPGAALAVRRAALEAAGGIEAVGSHLADDVRLGLAVAAAGYRIGVGPAVRLEAGPADFSRFRSLIERAAVIFGRTVPRPVAALHAWVNWAYLPALAVPASRLPALAYLLARCVALAWADGRIGSALLLPVLDLSSAVLYATTLVRGRVTWRGLDYAFDRLGRVRTRAGTGGDPDAGGSGGAGSKE